MVLTLGFGLGLASTALPALAVPATPASPVEAATQSLKAGDHAKALEQVNRFLATKPKDAQGRFLKGLILTGMNKPTDAIAVFRKLTEDFPDLPEPYNNLAVIYAQQKQFDKARDALEQAIRTHPAYATAHENLGDIYSRLASQAYGHALQIDSSNASAQTKLAMINELVGAPVKVGAGGTAPAAPPQLTPPPVPPVVVQPVVQPALPPIVVAAASKTPATPPAEPAKSSPAKSAPVIEPPKTEAPKTEPPKAEPTKVEPSKPEPAKPAATKVESGKADSAKPAAVKPADLTTDIAAAVDGWLTAWSKKDVRVYLSHYAKDFQTPGGQARKAWEAERQQRVGKPGRIDVSRDKLSIKLEGDDKATVRFRQHYKSASFNSSSGKTLVLVKREGKWQIQQEQVGG